MFFHCLRIKLYNLLENSKKSHQVNDFFCFPFYNKLCIKLMLSLISDAILSTFKAIKLV